MRIAAGRKWLNLNHFLFIFKLNFFSPKGGSIRSEQMRETFEKVGFSADIARLVSRGNRGA